MPDFSQEFSRFFSSEDFEDGPRTLTITDVKLVNTAQEGQPPDHKPVIYCKEFKKGLVLNKTRYNDAADIFDSKNTDTWVGKKITAFRDPSIKFGSKRVGGVAVKAAGK